MDISKLEEKICDNCISEELIMDYCDENGLSIIQFSKICEELVLNNISIISKEKYNALVLKSSKNKTTDDKKFIHKQDAFSNIIAEFSVLALNDKYKCLSKLAFIIAQEEQRAKDNIKDNFINTFQKKPLQYTYFTVLVKAFFATTNRDGQADLSAIIDYHYDYYTNRKRKGLKVEKLDSLFCKQNFEKEDIRKNILYNPMRRSFLIDFFVYNKDSDTIQIDSALWDSLTNEDINKIISIADSKLELYYQKLESDV